MISAISLFCEDIRPEVGGSATIVGVLPDNVGVPSVPGAVPKLGIYTRILVPTDAEPQSIQVVLRDPAGGETILGVFTSEFVKASCDQARERGNPLTGFVSTALTAPFPVAMEGRSVAITRYGSEEQITGSVNFRIGHEEDQAT